MKSCFGALLGCSLLLLCGLIAFGQESSGTMTSTIVVRDGMERIPRFVAGMPYSAETEAEGQQTGTDGTRFDRKMTRTKTYRDSQGRTRMEHYMPTGLSNSDKPTLLNVTIEDPVAGKMYFLNPREHTAREKALHVPHAEENGGATRIQTRTMMRTDQPQPKITVEDLGTQVIDGLVVEGKKTTMTIPANAQGNDKPFDIVTERWFSKELETYILIKNSDPRSGEHTIKTTITSRAEPDPALFQVPADYTITQQ